MSSVKICDWRPVRKGALLGFAKVELPSGMVISDVTILSGDRGAWASPPSKPMIGRDGVVLKDDSGKVRYSMIIEFTSKEVRQRWSDGVVAAVRTAYPDAFG